MRVPLGTFVYPRPRDIGPGPDLPRSGQMDFLICHVEQAAFLHERGDKGLKPELPTHAFALCLTDWTITPEQAAKLLERNVAEVAAELAARVPDAEISPMLRIQLAWLRSGQVCSFGGKVHAFDHRVIVDEIAHLENPSLPTSTKGAEALSGMLKGFWHKHFFEASMLVKNLMEEYEKYFDTFWYRDFLKAWHADPVQLTGLIGQTLVHGAFLNRQGASSAAAKSRVTGEWLVFAKDKGRNIYLTIAVHGEKNASIALRLWQCGRAYPFVLELLQSNGVEISISSETPISLSEPTIL
jgi:hypothetical protein